MSLRDSCLSIERNITKRLRVLARKKNLSPTQKAVEGELFSMKSSIARALREDDKFVEVAYDVPG